MKHSLQSMIRDLRLRRGRERRGLALAEGIRLVEEALAADIALRGAAVSPGLETTPRGLALKASLARAGVRLEEVSERELSDLADTEQPQGVLAIIEPRAWRLQDIDLRTARPVLVLDGVQDPGNVGTLARTALGLGAAGLVALKGTAELANPKVLRGSMGALFRLPSVAASAEEVVPWAREAGLALWVAAMDGEPVARVPRGERPIGLVVGNEGAGVGAAMAAAAERRVAIPLQGGTESLNVAVAGALLLYEVTRAG